MTKKLVPVVLLALAGLGSCSRSARIEVTPTPVDSTTFYTYSMSSVYSLLKVVPKTVTMNVATGGAIVGNSGTIYTFPANAFQTAGGGSVTGNITLSLSEYVKKGDMIFSRVLPVSDGQTLISGGQILVEATQGGSKLILKPGYNFTASIPQLGQISDYMSLYYGYNVNTTVSPINWVTGTGTGTATRFGDTVTLNADSVGYLSAGKPYAGATNQAIALTVNGLTFDDSDHVQAYAVYDNYRSITPMLRRYHQKFTQDSVLNVPTHFVVYTVYRGEFYAGISSSVTPLSGGSYSVTVSKVNPITFLHTVNGM